MHPPQPPLQDTPHPLALPAPPTPIAPAPTPAPPTRPVRDGVWPQGSRSAPAGALSAMVMLGVLAGLSAVAPPGAHWLVIVALAVLVVVGISRRARQQSAAAERSAAAGGKGSAPRPGAGDRALVGLALALVAVAALRADAVTVWGAGLAGLGLLLVVALQATRWPQVLSVGWSWLELVRRALRWVGASGAGRLAQARQGMLRPTLVGLAVGGPVVAVVTWLLGSADPAYARILGWLQPHVGQESVVQLLASALAVVLGAVAAFTRSHRPHWPMPRPRPRSAQLAHWAVGLVGLDLVLGLFAGVQITSWFDDVRAGRLSAPAASSDAHAVFWQLIAVTVIVLVSLSAVAAFADRSRPTHDRALRVSGGLAVLGTLVVCASALQRMWRYQDTAGWTVLRLQVIAFELWLGALLVALGVMWWRRQTAAVPRLVVGSAALTLLVLGLVGPDALVARWNVERYAQTGQFDTEYAGRLSLDAVPALAALPSRLRDCTFVGLLRPGVLDSAPWYAVNLGRARAEATLAELYGDAVPARPWLAADGCPTAYESVGEGH